MATDGRTARVAPRIHPGDGSRASTKERLLSDKRLLSDMRLLSESTCFSKKACFRRALRYFPDLRSASRRSSGLWRLGRWAARRARRDFNLIYIFRTQMMTHIGPPPGWGCHKRTHNRPPHSTHAIASLCPFAEDAGARLLLLQDIDGHGHPPTPTPTTTLATSDGLREYRTPTTPNRDRRAVGCMQRRF